MAFPRRRLGPVLCVLVPVLLAACGSSAGGVATGPTQTHGLPDTTAPATPSPTPSLTPPPTPAPTPTPTPTPRPLATALPQPSPTPYVIPSSDANGAQDVGNYVYSSIAGVACGGRTHHYDNCPLTARLIQRLDSNPMPDGEPLCRCQNYWSSSTVTVTETPDPAVWIDHVVLNFGSYSTIKIDLRVLQTSDGWLGDDTTCTGHGETTSIYVDNPPTCS